MCKMTMMKVRVQQQIAASDCGLFAIAFAVALVNGQDPAALTFDQGVMRQHLRLCLQRQQMEPFPTIQEAEVQEEQSGWEGGHEHLLSLQRNLGD